eukprot:Awhi_evm1s9161
MNEYELPLYNQDVEKKGFPDNVHKLRKIFDESNGILIASPEYNGCPTPLLLNTISWLSRSLNEDDFMYAAFKGKTGMIMSSSPGGLGGIRNLPHTRQLLTNVGVCLLPHQVAIGSGYKAFDEKGALVDPRQSSQLDMALDEFFKYTRYNTNQENVKTLVCGYINNEYGQMIVPETKEEQKE